MNEKERGIYLIGSPTDINGYIDCRIPDTLSRKPIIISILTSKLKGTISLLVKMKIVIAWNNIKTHNSTRQGLCFINTNAILRKPTSLLYNVI